MGPSLIWATRERTGEGRSFSLIFRAMYPHPNYRFERTSVVVSVAAKRTLTTDGFGSAAAHTSHVDSGPGLTNGSTVMDQLIRSTSYRREPWNKGKLVGQKAPLKLKDIWAIRVRLQFCERARELALFNLAIDSKLRYCDLVKLRV